MSDSNASLTPDQLKAGLDMVRAVADAIRDLKQVPSGKLYAVLMGHMDLGGYQKIIQILINAGLVTEENHMLKWVEQITPEQHNTFPRGRWNGGVK